MIGPYEAKCGCVLIVASVLCAASFVNATETGNSASNDAAGHRWVDPDRNASTDITAYLWGDPDKKYSTDIAAALEALEKDDGAGWDFALTRYAASSVPWQVEASRHADGLVISEAGETLALAICRVLINTRNLAALKTVAE